MRAGRLTDRGLAVTHTHTHTHKQAQVHRQPPTHTKYTIFKLSFLHWIRLVISGVCTELAKDQTKCLAHALSRGPMSSIKPRTYFMCTGQLFTLPSSLYSEASVPHIQQSSDRDTFTHSCALRPLSTLQEIGTCSVYEASFVFLKAIAYKPESNMN